MQRSKLEVILAVGILIVGLLVPATQAQPARTLGRAQVVVDAALLAAKAARPDVRILDLSSTREVFERGHISGAAYADWRVDLVDPTHRVGGMAPTREQFQALMRRLGIRNTDAVILYDDTSSLFAARAFWIFKLYRHERVAILNGGSRRWAQEGRPLATGAGAGRFAPSDYAAPPRDESILVALEELVARLDTVQIVDARSPPEYAGLDVRAARGGHIPGAVNINWTLTVHPDGTFRSAEHLRALYARAGISRDREVVVYCQTGVRAAHSWFVLRYLLGYPRVRVYDGSWEEWGNRADLPVRR